MGELIVIGDGEDMRTVEEVRVEDEEEKREFESLLLRETGPFKWEKFLPVTGIRVLLVEADDSTRHIIAALLRKCNYKVIAISDGLEAWKVLKGRHSNIDLILTEADLPSISGYALLSLIMEHQCCKHIPVVMMSSGDSINMVFKCMSSGAADFLTKPLRKNELKNLWQHVWRRLSVNGGNEPRDDLNNGQCKADAMSGKEAANNLCSESSDNASANKKRQPNEKASEVQSFYTKHCLEAENARKESVQGFSAKRHSEEPANLSRKKKKLQHEENVKLNESSTNKKLYIPTSIAPKDGESCIERMSMVDGVAPEEGCKNMASGELQKPSRVAIDLIGRIDDQQSCIFKGSSSDHETINKFTFDPQLELSLSGFQDKENQGMEEMVKLKHSDASAFSRYGYKQMGSRFPSSSSICTETNGGVYGISTDLALSENTPSSSGGFRRKSTTVVNQSPETGGTAVFRSSHEQSTPLAFNGICVGYGTVFQPNYGSQVLPVAINPSLALQKESSPFSASSSLHSSDPGTLSSTPGRCQYDQEATNPFSGPQPVHEHKASASMEQHQSTNGQSASSSVSTRITQLPSSNDGCKTVSDGTMGSATPGANIVQNARVEECTNADAVDKDHVLKHDQIKGRNPHRNALREAALAKFKQKRKDRCFDKKVRYQSRKKLAEQRPRVKGQFVRQA